MQGRGRRQMESQDANLNANLNAKLEQANGLKPERRPVEGSRKQVMLTQTMPRRIELISKIAVRLHFNTIAL